MAQANIPLVIPKGTTYRKGFLWKQGPVGGPFTPVDLTGASGRCHFRETHADTSTLVELSTSAGGGITFGGNTGAITIELSPARSALLTATGVYDLEVTLANGDVLRPFGGTFQGNDGVTRG